MNTDNRNTNDIQSAILHFEEGIFNGKDNFFEEKYGVVFRNIHSFAKEIIGSFRSTALAELEKKRIQGVWKNRAEGFIISLVVGLILLLASYLLG